MLHFRYGFWQTEVECPRNDRVADGELLDGVNLCDTLHIVILQAAPYRDTESKAIRKIASGHYLCKLCTARCCILCRGIRAGVELDSCASHASRRFDLCPVGRYKQRVADACLLQGCEKVGQYVLITKYVKPTQGVPVRNILRYQAHVGRPDSKREIPDLLVQRKLKSETSLRAGSKAFSIIVLDVTLVSGQVHSYEISTGKLCL